MDQAQLLELARQLVTYAGPLIAGGALAKIGENTNDVAQQWLEKTWGSLKRRLTGSEDAVDALRMYERKPEDPARQTLVTEQIVTIYQHDQAAIAELQALVEELRRIQPQQPAPSRTHTQNISDNARVGTAIAGDVTGNVTNIGGAVHGPVMSGTFHQPVHVGPTTTRNVNTGGGDYVEGNLDKSRRVIIGGGMPPTAVQIATPGQRTRGSLPATLSADNIHFSYGHALVIGVGEYANRWQSAPTTANDAAQFAALLKDPAHAAYLDSQVTLLQNQAATKTGILDALTTLGTRLKAVQDAKQKPTVVIFFAGHGTNQDGSFALLPHDYDAANANSTTVSARAFRNAVQALIPYCQKLVVLLNCCYAGGTAGQVLAGTPTPSDTSSPSRDFIETLVTGSGQVVISSSRSNQPSAAVAEDDTNLTTFGSKLLKGLRGAAPGSGPAIGILDLFAYLAAAVPADARGITHAGKPLDQQPLLYAREVDQNFPIALRPAGQARGTLDAAQQNVVQRLAQIEIALFALDRDSDAPHLVRERDTLLKRLQ
jgi:hypothetical protein